VLPDFLDTQCGFKCFRREAAEEIFRRQRTTGFEFDVELLCLARELGYSVAEVPVTWRNRPRSHVRFFRDSARMALGLLRLRGRFPSGAPSLGGSTRAAVLWRKAR
jgi:dolichyl-phosphate beta-glucosyltransferase